eukprot:1177158-Pyramimonas_sp.AAC.1
MSSGCALAAIFSRGLALLGVCPQLPLNAARPIFLPKGNSFAAASSSACTSSQPGVPSLCGPFGRCLGDCSVTAR